jgi:hypothetical protein
MDYVPVNLRGLPSRFKSSSDAGSLLLFFSSSSRRRALFYASSAIDANLYQVPQIYFRLQDPQSISHHYSMHLLNTSITRKVFDQYSISIEASFYPYFLQKNALKLYITITSHTASTDTLPFS